MATFSPSQTLANPLTLSPSRVNAPLHTPSDIKAFLTSFDLDIRSLLTVGNPKISKTHGAHTVIHHALPHRGLARAIDPTNVGTTSARGFLSTLRDLAESHSMVDAAKRHNGCLGATPGCVLACLNDAGHGGINAVCAHARGRRTLAMIADPITYTRAMVWALAREFSNAARHGMPLAFRLCGTDETPWHRRAVVLTHHETCILSHRFGVDAIAGTSANVAEAFAPMVADGRMVPYEYLKLGVGHDDGPLAWLAAGWSDITASFAADRFSACADAVRALDAGLRIAVPIAWPKREALPTVAVITLTDGTVRTVPCIDGDVDDARFRNPGRCVVLLREKRSRAAGRSLAGSFILPHGCRHTLADGRLDVG